MKEKFERYKEAAGPGARGRGSCGPPAPGPAPQGQRSVPGFPSAPGRRAASAVSRKARSGIGAAPGGDPLGRLARGWGAVAGGAARASRHRKPEGKKNQPQKPNKNAQTQHPPQQRDKRREQRTSAELPGTPFPLSRKAPRPLPGPLPCPARPCPARPVPSRPGGAGGAGEGRAALAARPRRCLCPCGDLIKLF